MRSICRRLDALGITQVSLALLSLTQSFQGNASVYKKHECPVMVEENRYPLKLQQVKPPRPSGCNPFRFQPNGLEVLLDSHIQN